MVISGKSLLKVSSQHFAHDSGQTSSSSVAVVWLFWRLFGHYVYQLEGIERIAGIVVAAMMVAILVLEFKGFKSCFVILTFSEVHFISILLVGVEVVIAMIINGCYFCHHLLIYPDCVLPGGDCRALEACSLSKYPSRHHSS